MQQCSSPNDRPFLGVLLMVGFCALVPFSDSLAKILGETIPLIEVLVVRFTAQSLLVLPVIFWSGRSLAMTRRILLLTVVLTLLQAIGIGAMFTSLRFLPLADAVAIAFVMPFIMLALGRMVLKEEVGPRRLAACVVGFTGALLVIQPSFAIVGSLAMLPLLVSVSFAFYMLITRQIVRDTDPVTLQGVSGFMAAVGLIVLLLFTANKDIPGLRLVMPNSTETLLLVGVGVLGPLAHLLMTWSLRFAPSATLAPIQYLEIPFATLIGWIIFRDLPNGLAATGIAITMAAGLYIVFRERKQVQLVPQET